MRDEGRPVLLPDNPAPHITDWLLEIGPTVSGAMGESAISWQEIEAWQRSTGIELDAWESRTIRKLSQAFIGQRHDAKARDCPAPFTGKAEQIADRRADVAMRIRAALGSRARK